jgi:DNA-binding NtrC family response regulator
VSRRLSIQHPRKTEPVLWIVDSDQWPRACLRAELIERGYHAVGFITLNDALASLSKPRSPKPDALILELKDQELSQDLIDSIRQLGIPTILLGGSAELNHPLIRGGKWDVVLKKPFSLGTIADLVQKLVPKRDIKPPQRP